MAEHIIANGIAPAIDTERLRLRPHRLSDFSAMAALYRSERSRFIGGPLAEKEVWAGFMEAIGEWAILGQGAWAIERKHDGALAGQVAVAQPIQFPERELGWLLFDGFEGQGIACEAARAARGFAFEVLKAKTLVSYIDPENVRSIKLAERLGAVRDANAKTPENAPTLVFRHRRP